VELTREVLEDMARCREKYCPDCKGVCKDDAVKSGIETLATALLEERAKPKVWDGAPEWATKAVINWSAKTHYSGVYKEYTRTLPKSRIDEIAEEAVDKYQRGAVGAGSLKDIIKSAILKDREEREAER